MINDRTNPMIVSADIKRELFPWKYQAVAVVTYVQHLNQLHEPLIGCCVYKLTNTIEMERRKPKMAKGKLYTDLYERLNHDDELQGESNSISHQKQILQEYAMQRHIAWHRFVISQMMVFPGIRFDRPGFIQMMNEVKVGNIGTIIIKDMSRLGRDYLVVGQIQEIWCKQSYEMSRLPC